MEVVVEEVAIAQHLEGLKDERSCIWKCHRGQHTESFSSELRMPQRQQIKVLSRHRAAQSTPTLQHLLTAGRAKAEFEIPLLCPPQGIPPGCWESSPCILPSLLPSHGGVGM